MKKTFQLLPIGLFVAGFLFFVAGCERDFEQVVPEKKQMQAMEPLDPEGGGGGGGYTAPTNYTATALHVRYKNSLWNWSENSALPFWSSANVQKDARERTWLTEMWKPAGANIENVVVLFAGQQGARQSWGSEANISTGQNANWRPSKEAKSSTISFRIQSLAGAIYTDGKNNGGVKYGFRPDNTLLIMVYDAAFYYMYSEGKKNEVENAYYNYIVDRIGGYHYKVKTIYLGGASRGATLATRLTKRFMNTSSFYNANFLLTTLDAVANRPQGECGTYNSEKRNPYNYDYFAYKTDLKAYFPSSRHAKLKMFQVIGGSSVVFEGSDLFGVAHAFIDKNYPGRYDDLNVVPTYPFGYEVKWVNRSHTDIGRPYHDDTAGATLRWLDANH